MERMTYAIDFDGTLCKFAFPSIGIQEEIHIKIMNFAKRKKAEGHLVILWTCRTGEYLTEAVDWCKAHGLEFDYINENPEDGFYGTSRKIGADWYIDDKALFVYGKDLAEMLDKI